MNVVTGIFKWSGLAMLWMFQYTLYVPAMIAVKALGLALKMGFLGILLLCIPVLGWIVLAVLVFRRSPPNLKRSIMLPWGLPNKRPDKFGGAWAKR